MKTLLHFLCLSTLASVAWAGDRDPAGTVTVTLGLEARTRGTEVELGEIAQVAGTDPAVVDSVRAVELGYAPAPGYSRVFRADRIAQVVRAALPNVTVRLSGQAATRVHPEVERIAGGLILSAARTHLSTSLIGREITFESTSVVPDVEVPAGAGQHELRARLPDVPEASRVISVPVEILVDGARYRTVWTSWSVDVWETRPVLARAVRAGEVLSPAMFHRQKIKRTAGEVSLLDEGLLHGSVALRDLRPGEVVTALDVQRPTVIVAGESLFLRVRKGSINARVPALALQSGSVGDRIRIKTLEGEQELVATVSSRDTCTIDLGN